jgi:hypothetical protein
MQDNQGSNKTIFGMKPLQVGVILLLAIGIIVIIAIFAKMMLDAASVPTPAVAEQPISQSQPEATYTTEPSPTPVPTSTPRPTITSIPGWRQHKFWNNKGELWLPEGYEGADLTQDYQDFLAIFRALAGNDEFADSIEQQIAQPDYVFFAYDTNMDEATRLIYITVEPIESITEFNMNSFLNDITADMSASTRIIIREIINLDSYEAGKLYFEDQAQAGESSVYLTYATYRIQIDNLLWSIIYRVGRDDFKTFEPIIEESVRSFTAFP